MTTPAIAGLKFGSARDLAFPTYGSRQREFGRIWIGRQFMPWQQLVADVAGEYDPETGLIRPERQLVVVTGPRQMGKSDLCLVSTSERAFSRPPSAGPFRAWYTAQTGMDARDQFLKFATETIADTALQAATRLYRGSGSERLSFANRSTIRPHPPTEKALHGKQSDRNDVDEAWAFPLDHGRLLMQAIAPTQLTRPGAQTFIWSAGGTPLSTWLADYVARGRDGDPTFTFFDFGVPDDLNVNDLDVVLEHHPAAGYTISPSSLRNLRTQLVDDADWARAAGNRWTEIVGGAISVELWASTLETRELPIDAPVAYGVAAALDGSHTAVVAAARLDDDVVVGELVEVIPGVYGAAERAHVIAHDGPLVTIADGPSLPIADTLERIRKRNLVPLTGKDYAAATGLTIAALKARKLRHRPDDLGVLDASAKAAGTRPHQDGGRVWARVAAGGSVAALEAFTAAFRGVTHGRRGPSKPITRTASDRGDTPKGA